MSDPTQTTNGGITGMRKGLCRLGAASGETIEIAFTARNNSATPGSSAWSVVTTNVRVTIRLPASVPAPMSFMMRMRGMIAEPYAYIQQYVQMRLTRAGAFDGSLAMPLYIAGGSNGQQQSYKQFFQFDRLTGYVDQNNLDDFPRNGLLDPITSSWNFQIDMSAAVGETRL